MRRRKEGTLKSVEYSGLKRDGKESGDDFEKACAEVAKISFVGVADFIAKARSLINRVDAAPYRMRAERARSLARDLDDIERAMKRGVAETVIYAAIGAALTFASLSRAELDDSDTYKKKKSIKVGRFLSAENTVRKSNLRRGVTRRPGPKEIADAAGVHKNSVSRILRRDVNEE